MMEKKLLTPEDFNRTGRVVSRGEQVLFNNFGNANPWADDTTTQVLKIQAGAANAFGYPARIQKWDDSAGSLSDFDTTEVRVEGPNGGVFIAGQYVIGRALGSNTSGVGCFSTSGVEWGYTALNVPGVISVNLTNGQTLGNGIKRVAAAFGVGTIADAESLSLLAAVTGGGANDGLWFCKDVTDSDYAADGITGEEMETIFVGAVHFVPAVESPPLDPIAKFTLTAANTTVANVNVIPGGSSIATTYTSQLVSSADWHFTDGGSGAISGTNFGLIGYRFTGGSGGTLPATLNFAGFSTSPNLTGGPIIVGINTSGGDITPQGYCVRENDGVTDTIYEGMTGFTPGGGAFHGGILTNTASFTAGQLLAGNGTSQFDSVANSRLNGENLEIKLAADRWLAFSKGSY